MIGGQIIPDRRILLTKEQIETLSKQFVEELHEIPLYKTDTKKKLISEYINKVQEIIKKNIHTFANDFPDCDAETLRARIVADILEN